MNEAEAFGMKAVEDAVVIQMRRGNRKNALKFSAFVVLILTLAAVVAGVTATISTFAKAFFGV